MVEADIIQLILFWIAQNIWFLGAIFLNIVFFFILFRMSQLLGPFFKDSFIVAFGFMKDPNLFVIFGQSRRLALEWRPYSSLQNTVKDDKTSEIVLVDRTQDSQAGTTKSQKGFFNLIRNKVPKNQTYGDRGTFVNFDANKEFRSWGYSAHVILQGQNKTINPLDSVKQDPKSRFGSFAVIEAIEGWKAYNSGFLQDNMVTKRMFIIAMIFLGIIVLVNFFFTLNINTFTDGLGKALEHYKPAIDQAYDAAIKTMPRMEAP